MKDYISKNRIRNLKQYRNLSDEEFEKIYSEMVTGVSLTQEFEKRIQDKIDEFSRDYDLSDLKINDLLALRALAQAFISLEDFERYSYKLQEGEGGFDEVDIVRLEKLNNIKSNLRNDINKLQDSLGITRRNRKASEQESVIDFVESLKQKAKRFYESKMKIILCPKCGTWIASVWMLYPESKKAKLRFHCKRKFPDGTYCDTVFDLTGDELARRDGRIPESIS